MGNIYIVSRGRYDESSGDYDCHLHRIDSETDEVITTYHLPVLSFTISGYKAYMYSYNSKQESIQVMDTVPVRLLTITLSKIKQNSHTSMK